MKHLLCSSLDDHFFSTNRTRKHNVLFTIVNQRLKYDVPSGATHAVPRTQSDLLHPPKLLRKNPWIFYFSFSVLEVFSFLCWVDYFQCFLHQLLPLKTVVNFSKVSRTVIILTPWACDIIVFFKEMSEAPIMKLKSYFQDSVVQKRNIQLLIGWIVRWLPSMFSFPFLSRIQSGQLLVVGFLRKTVLGLRQWNLTLQGQSCSPCSFR